MFGTPSHMLRRNDAPVTSHEAAAAVDSAVNEEIVLNAIAAFGSDGCIADQVLSVVDMPYGSVTSRFSALERKGLITCGPDKRQGNSGRNQRVMRANNA